MLILKHKTDDVLTFENDDCGIVEVIVKEICQYGHTVTLAVSAPKNVNISSTAIQQEN